MQVLLITEQHYMHALDYEESGLKLLLMGDRDVEL